jgi:hypothetical protein
VGRTRERREIAELAPEVTCENDDPRTAGKKGVSAAILSRCLRRIELSATNAAAGIVTKTKRVKAL